MACKGCAEQAKVVAPGGQTFGVTLMDVDVALAVQGALTPLTHSMLKDWLGLVYDQLRPDPEVPHVGDS
jgi:hypothetical protein